MTSTPVTSLLRSAFTFYQQRGAPWGGTAGGWSLRRRAFPWLGGSRRAVGQIQAQPVPGTASRSLSRWLVSEGAAADWNRCQRKQLWAGNVDWGCIGGGGYCRGGESERHPGSAGIGDGPNHHWNWEWNEKDKVRLRTLQTLMTLSQKDLRLPVKVLAPVISCCWRWSRPWSHGGDWHLRLSVFGFALWESRLPWPSRGSPLVTPR